MERKAFLKNNGYVVIKEFFSSEEVCLLRTLCLSEKFKKNGCVIVGDIITHEAFRKIIFTEKLIDLLRLLVGDELFYICDGTARGNDTPITKDARKFHSDSRGDDFNFNNEYPLYRLGIYLQDTNTFSGGLKVRPKSHQRLCIDHGTIYNCLYRWVKYIQRYKRIPPVSISGGENVELKSGDLLIWNMRLHHSGYAVRLKWCPNVSLHPIFENWIPSTWTLPFQNTRCVLFFAFGKESEYLRDYYYYIKDHPDNILHWKNSDFQSDELTKLCNKLSFHLINSGYILSPESEQEYKKKKFF